MGKPKPTNFPKTVWGYPGWFCYYPEWQIKVSVRSTLLKLCHPPTLEFSTRSNKNSCSSKNCTQFNTLPSDILNTIDTWYFSLVHHKNSIKSWCKSNIRINLNVPPGLINSSISHSKALWITKTSFTCGRADAYPPTHPSMTSYRESAQSNTNLSKHHMTQRDSSASHLSTLIPIFQKMTYLHTFLLPRILSQFCPKFLTFQIPHFIFPPV